MFSSHECSVADVTEYNQLPIEIRKLIARVWCTEIQSNFMFDVENIPEYLREPKV